MNNQRYSCSVAKSNTTNYSLATDVVMHLVIFITKLGIFFQTARVSFAFKCGGIYEYAQQFFIYQNVTV